MNVYDKNSNGETYLILEQYKDRALLARIGDPKFIIAYSFDAGASSWGSGAYFNNIGDAYNRFKEVK